MAPVLLVEDDPNDALLVSRAFRQAGVARPLVVARDGQQAIDFLEFMSRDRWALPPPALLLLDLQMPRLSGFDVLVWLRARPEFNSLPAVVLSSSPQAPDMLMARELGAADYRVNPSHFEDRVKLVRELHACWLGPRPAAMIPTYKSQVRTFAPKLAALPGK